MRRQRKNPSSNGMEDASIKELNEMEASKPSDTEFKRPVIRMLKEFSENYMELYGSYKELAGTTAACKRTYKVSIRTRKK